MTTQTEKRKPWELTAEDFPWEYIGVESGTEAERIAEKIAQAIADGKIPHTTIKF